MYASNDDFGWTGFGTTCYLILRERTNLVDVRHSLSRNRTLGNTHGTLHLGTSL